jgi:hypothetical protein
MTHHWINHSDELIEGLLTHQSSPLKNFLQELDTQYDSRVVRSALTAYLNDKKDSDIILNASQPMKEAFALYKEQLKLLPQTLRRHHKEHYGPSKSNQSAFIRALAIPYAANDKPSARSRFGNPLETLNYTIQSTLIDGLNELLLIELIKQWKVDSCSELEKDYSNYKELEHTPTAKMVARYLEGTPFKLHGIDTNNISDIQVLTEHLRYNKSLLLALLEQRILPQITLEPAILHSDVYNHVDLYRSAQGLSGTPWNHSTYHQRLKFNYITSLGTDGYIQEVIKGKNTRLHPMGFTNITEFLPNLYEKIGIEKKESMRAIMDISATFQGCSNISVAQALATFHKDTQPPIKYILYYNDDDILYALDVQQKKSPIRLGTSNLDEISRKLSNCKPEERFTYYDQAHTIGMDIAQAPHSGGICLVDSNTHLQSFLQGSMRMRGLNNNQHIEIIVPEDMAAHSLDALLEKMKKNERDQLKEDKFIGTLAEMENIIRNDLRQRIDNLDDDNIDMKYEWATAFQCFFVKKNESNIFKQYGGISHEEDTETLLKKHQATLISNWKTCLSSAKIDVDFDTSSEALLSSMGKLIATAVPLCKKSSVSRAQQGSEGLEVEVMKEQNVANEVEKLAEEECFNPKLYACSFHDWDADRLQAFTMGNNILGDKWNRITISALNDLCPPFQGNHKSIFSPQFLATDNYSKVYREQQNMLGFYLKPVDVILFRMINDTVTACLVSNQEADQLTKLMDKDPQQDHVWLSSTQHTLLAGKAPPDLQSNIEYLALMEQIQFFGGKCNEISMAEETTPLVWLQDETKEKLSWFEKYIMPYRETEPHDLIELRNVISKKNAVKVSDIKANFDTIVEHHCNEQANPASQYRASINVIREGLLSDTAQTVQQTSNDAEAIDLHAANCNVPR